MQVRSGAWAWERLLRLTLLPFSRPQSLSFLFPSLPSCWPYPLPLHPQAHLPLISPTWFVFLISFYT